MHILRGRKEKKMKCAFCLNESVVGFSSKKMLTPADRQRQEVNFTPMEVLVWRQFESCR
jgi:hypothetical protein